LRAQPFQRLGFLVRDWQNFSDDESVDQFRRVAARAREAP
jgi:hypothetical protein